MKNLWKWIFGTQKRSEQLPNDDVLKAIKKQLTENNMSSRRIIERKTQRLAKASQVINRYLGDARSLLLIFIVSKSF
jgi:hypothetical protein